MSLWRLEWLRLVRTRRLAAILGVYLFFGLTGPFTARYLAEILDRFGAQGVRVEFPAPVPADGVAQFTSNAAQIGLLVVVLVAASALAFDTRREMAVFLRTRVRGVWSIVLPAYVTSTGAAVAGLLIGSLAMWYETSVLLGRLPAARMLAGIGFGALFLAFAVAVVALAASLVRGVLATVGLALILLLGLGLLGSITTMDRWLPTTLVGAMAGLARDAGPGDYLPAAVVTAVLTVAAVGAAVGFGSRREV